MEEQVRDLAFFDADALIATGQCSGHSASLDYIGMIKPASRLPTRVGSGVTPKNVNEILDFFDGVILACSLEVKGVARVSTFPAGLRR